MNNILNKLFELKRDIRHHAGLNPNRKWKNKEEEKGPLIELVARENAN